MIDVFDNLWRREIERMMKQGARTIISWETHYSLWALCRSFPTNFIFNRFCCKKN